MKLSPEQFEEYFQQKKLHIAFVGMSNIGKSHRTKEIGKLKNFSTKEVDAHIGKVLGIPSLDGLSEWMGQPFSSHFSLRQKKYLEAEEICTKKAIEEAEGNCILDTTGSIIYLSEEVKKMLSEHFFIVLFDTPNSLLQKMMESFFESPKPLVWGEMFFQREGELEEDALRRCYPDLLSFRRKKYLELADMVIPGEISRSPKILGDEFWDILRGRALR